MAEFRESKTESPENLYIRKPEHLAEGFKPIMACVGTKKQFGEEISAIKDIENVGENINFYAEVKELDEKEQKHSGEYTYVISSINENSKYSEDFQECTSLVIVGRDVKTGKEISFLTHQFPVRFLDDKKREFEEHMRASLEDFKKKCVPGSIDAVIAGGFIASDDLKESDDNTEQNKYYQQSRVAYERSLEMLKGVVKENLGFMPDVVSGVKGGGFDKIYFDTAERKLYVIRPDGVVLYDSAFTPTDENIATLEKQWGDQAKKYVEDQREKQMAKYTGLEKEGEKKLKIRTPDIVGTKGYLPDNLCNAVSGVDMALQIDNPDLLRKQLGNLKKFDEYYQWEANEQRIKEIDNGVEPCDVIASVQAQREAITDPKAIVEFDRWIGELKKEATLNNKVIDKKEVERILHEEIYPLIKGGKKEFNTLKSEHLKKGVMPIIACVGTKENYGLEELKKIENFKKTSENIEYPYDPKKLKELGYKTGGEKTYTISDISIEPKFSEDSDECTFLAAVGTEKGSGENISILTHQDPKSFHGETRDSFEKDLRESLLELKKRCEDKSVDIVIAGGRYHMKGYLDKDGDFDNYEKSLKILEGVVKEIFGFEPVVISGPKNKAPESVYLNGRRLDIIRPSPPAQRYDGGFTPDQVEKMKEKWDNGERQQ